jgi:hypothetical protein
MPLSAVARSMRDGDVLLEREPAEAAQLRVADRLGIDGDQAAVTSGGFLLEDVQPVAFRCHADPADGHGP